LNSPAYDIDTTWKTNETLKRAHNDVDIFRRIAAAATGVCRVM